MCPTLGKQPLLIQDLPSLALRHIVCRVYLGVCQSVPGTRHTSGLAHPEHAVERRSVTGWYVQEESLIGPRVKPDRRALGTLSPPPEPAVMHDKLGGDPARFWRMLKPPRALDIRETRQLGNDKHGGRRICAEADLRTRPWVVVGTTVSAKPWQLSEDTSRIGWSSWPSSPASARGFGQPPMWCGSVGWMTSLDCRAGFGVLPVRRRE